MIVSMKFDKFQILAHYDVIIDQDLGKLGLVF